MKDFITKWRSPLFNICANFSRAKDSKWIYSTKQQEKLHRVSGNISIFTHLSTDTNNASLRLFEKVEQAHLVITNDRNKAQAYLSSLLKLQSPSHSHSSLPSQISSVKIQLNEFDQEKSIQAIKNPNATNANSLQFETEIEISKMIQLNKEENKEMDASHMAREASQLKEYMQMKSLEEKLIEFKNQKGHSPIFLVDEFESSVGQIWKIQKDGLNILCLFTQDDDSSIESIGKMIGKLEERNLSYDILTGSDGLMQAVVGSGLPADRFSLEYFPHMSKVLPLLERRKNMKITTCISTQTQNLETLTHKIQEVYGKMQIVFINHPKSNKKYFRGQISDRETYFQTYPQIFNDAPNQTMNIVIAPFISDFNEELKKQMNIKSHLMGEIMDPRINQVEMKILISKLEQMNKKEESFQVNTHLMVAEMITRFKDEEKVGRMLKKLFPRKKATQIEELIQEGQKYVVVDHLELKSEVK